MTVHQLKTQEIGPDKPSLSEMLAIIAKHLGRLDDIDEGFVDLISFIDKQGEEAKIEAIEEGRAIAWSILNRHGLAEGL